MYDEWTRRQLLGGVGGIVIAGCLDSGDTDDSGDSNDAEQTDPDDGETGNESDGENEPTIHEEYDTTEVRAVSTDGDELGSVTAAIADTSDLRYLGLSDTEDLPADRGMLFVFESAAERTFVMREMDFGIDIVYADEDGTITDIHHAPAPGPNEDGNEQEYPGRGQYVLEVVYEWTIDHDVSEGDVLAFDLEE